MRERAEKLEARPKYVVSSTRVDFVWTNSRLLTGDLRTGVGKLKDATPEGVLLVSGRLASGLDRLDLIDEYKLLVHPRIAGHGPTLYQSGLPGTQRLELITKMVRAGIACFATAFGAGFVLGSIRVPLLVPRYGERIAELVEAPFMLARRWVLSRS